MATCTSSIREGNRLETCYKDAGHDGEHCNGAQPTYWWPGENRGENRGPEAGAGAPGYRAPVARGDVAGSLDVPGVLPEPQSVQGAVVAARLARLRWALADETAMLARVLREQGEVEPVHEIDVRVLRQAANSLERVIHHLTRRA